MRKLLVWPMRLSAIARPLCPRCGKLSHSRRRMSGAHVHIYSEFMDIDLPCSLYNTVHAGVPSLHRSIWCG